MALLLLSTPLTTSFQEPPATLPALLTAWDVLSLTSSRAAYGTSSLGSPKRGNSAAVSRNEFIAVMRSPESSSTISAHG